MKNSIQNQVRNAFLVGIFKRFSVYIKKTKKSKKKNQAKTQVLK